MTLNARWYPSSLAKDPEAKKKLETSVLNSRVALERLREIITEEIKAGEALPKTDYDSPSWAYKQADRNGALRAYQNVLKLLEFLDDRR